MAALILSCSTGQGHNSAAEALREHELARGQEVQIVDTLTFISPALARLVSRGHAASYRHLRFLFARSYRHWCRHPELFRPGSWLSRLLSLGSGPLEAYIRAHDIDTVLCTHVFAGLMLRPVQAHLPRLAVGLVATDYTCNPGTRETLAQLHFIPDLSLAPDFEGPTLPESALRPSGIPIRQMFQEAHDPALAREALGIPRHLPHLLMMCGSMGCGPMAQLTRQLAREDIFLTVVCGTNKRLRRRLSRAFADSPHVQILGYVQDVSLLMDSADLCLTKPGGISVTEAARKNLPMVLLDAVAGCESFNKLYFIRRGGARTASCLRELRELTLRLLRDPEALGRMRRSLEALPKEDAAGIILSQMDGLRDSLREPA